jgi:hypothetical protein
VLEIAQRNLGPVTEDRVDPTRVKSERGKPMLQLSDVISAKHRSVEVEQAVAETVPGTDQCQPGPGVADPISWEVALFLKTRNRCDRGLAVNSKRIRSDEVQLAQTSLKVTDRFATVAFSERECPIGRDTGMDDHPLIVGEAVVVIRRI